MTALTKFLRARIDGRIVDAVMRYEAKIDGEWGCYHSTSEIENGACEITLTGYKLLRLLALPFANDPDYCPDWGV